MSTPTRKPYLSDEIVLGRPACDILGGKEIIYFPDAMRGTRVRNLYEAHLAERDALIQRVVDYWDKWQGKGCIEADGSGSCRRAVQFAWRQLTCSAP